MNKRLSKTADRYRYFEMSTQNLIKFFKKTSCECLTAVTVVAEVLTKSNLKKDELKLVVEQSIRSITYIIDEKKKAKLLEINLKVILF